MSEELIIVSLIVSGSIDDLYILYNEYPICFSHVILADEIFVVIAKTLSADDSLS